MDDLTVRVRLKAPFASFPTNLVRGIVPCGAVDLAHAPVGTGPYRFERMVRDDRVELARFDGYFGEPARNARLVLKVAPDLVWALKREPRLAAAESAGADFDLASRRDLHNVILSPTADFSFLAGVERR